MRFRECGHAAPRIRPPCRRHTGGIPQVLRAIVAVPVRVFIRTGLRTPSRRSARPASARPANQRTIADGDAGENTDPEGRRPPGPIPTAARRLAPAQPAEYTGGPAPTLPAYSCG